MTRRWRAERHPQGLEGMGQTRSKAKHPRHWGQATQRLAQAAGGPGGWRWQSGVEQGQGQALVGWLGGEQGPGVGRQTVGQHQG